MPGEALAGDAVTAPVAIVANASARPATTLCQPWRLPARGRPWRLPALCKPWRLPARGQADRAVVKNDLHGVITAACGHQEDDSCPACRDRSRYGVPRRAAIIAN